MAIRIEYDGEDITEQVDKAIRREATLNEMTSGTRGADIRSGQQVHPLEPAEDELN